MDIKQDMLEGFVKNALNKFQELNALSHIVMKEGPKPELIESIYRASTLIKTYASTCALKDIIDFISKELDGTFNTIRLENKVPTKETKERIEKILSQLKKMIQDVSSNKKIHEDHQNVKNVETSEFSILEAVGQMSIWNFHEILNEMTKIQGFIDFIPELYNSGIDEKSKDDLKYLYTKINESVNRVSRSTHRVRAMRGKVLTNMNKYNLKDLIDGCDYISGHHKKNLKIVDDNLSHVSVFCDKLLFEQVWIYLWKLLFEWQNPGTLIYAHCKSILDTSVYAKETPSFPDKIKLYIWYEPSGTIQFKPELLKFSHETPFPDLGHAFHFLKQSGQKTGIELTAAENAVKIPIFCVSIPCSQDRKEKNITENIQPTHELKVKTPETSKNKTILIVDDEKDIRSILTLKINKMGYSVQTASNLSEALQAIKQHNIHMVIADLFLGQESGLLLLKQIVEMGKKMPFVFITGADEDDVPESMVKVMTESSQAFLHKPIATEELKNTIEKFLK